jgi:nanoRNase/pAp phosphatase (c-di-AMP/oligoRNAs hydrolase)
MEGAEITLERLDYVLKAHEGGTLTDQVFCAFLGASPREDFIPYVADFFLQVEDVKWTVVAGIVGDSLVVSVRNLGYTKNAGEFVRRFFADIGSAGGHRAMAKAVMPMRAFREKFGDIGSEGIGARLRELVHEFLTHESKDKDKDVKSPKSEVVSR